MSRNRRIRAITMVITSAALGASLLAVEPAIASPMRSTTATAPGPCPLVRLSGEAIQDFSIRIITCAADKWPVEGGAEKAICIARRESGLIPTASSPTGQYVGLFQHSAADWQRRYDTWTKPAWHLKVNPYNGRTNAIVTMRIANDDGWDAWAGAGC